MWNIMIRKCFLVIFLKMLLFSPINVIGPGLFEGDIVLRPGEKESAYASIGGKRWPGTIVPNEIDDSISK